MTTTNRPYNEKWDAPEEHDGTYPPDWTARCHQAFDDADYTCQNCSWQGGPHAEDPVPEKEEDTEAESTEERRLHGKHIVPPSGGGTHTVSNIAVLCSECYTPPEEGETTEKQQSVPGASKEVTEPEEVSPRHGDYQTVETQGGQQQQRFGRLTPIISWFDFAEDTEETSFYHAFLRLSLAVSFMAVIVMLAFQIMLGVHDTLNTLTTNYTIALYTFLMVGVITTAVFLDYLVGPDIEYSMETNPPAVHDGAVQLSGIVLTAVLVIHAIGAMYLPLPGTGTEFYGSIFYAFTTVVYGVFALGMYVSIVTGSLDARHYFGFSLRPAIWIGVITAIPVLHLWTWLITGVPYAAPTETVFRLPAFLAPVALPGVTEAGMLPRKPILDVLVVLYPVVGMAYVARLKMLIRKFNENTEEQSVES